MVCGICKNKVTFSDNRTPMATDVKTYVPKAASPDYAGEDVLMVRSNMDFTEETTGIKIPHLELKLTSHRLILFHPTQDVFNFEWNFDQVTNWEIKVLFGLSLKTIYFRKEVGLAITIIRST